MSVDVPPPHPPGLIWMGLEAEGSVLHLRGEIDAATVAAFEDQAKRDTTPTTRPPIVAVDAQAVTFINSSAVTFLLRLIQGSAAPGRPPALRRPSKVVRQVLALTGVLTLFVLSEDE